MAFEMRGFAYGCVSLLETFCLLGQAFIAPVYCEPNIAASANAVERYAVAYAGITIVNCRANSCARNVCRTGNQPAFGIPSAKFV